MTKIQIDCFKCVNFLAARSDNLAKCDSCCSVEWLLALIQRACILEAGWWRKVELIEFISGFFIRLFLFIKIVKVSAHAFWR